MMTSHRRYNPLTDEWVIVASNRILRPWQGETSKQDDVADEKTEMVNALAPGGIRANGQVTPSYETTYTFNNDFPSMTDDRNLKGDFADGYKDDDKAESLFRSQKVRGICRVICYHPDSNLPPSCMTAKQLVKVIDAWIQQMNELEGRYEWIQIFENKGAMVGCSNPHPHGQLWASDFLPNIPAKKFATQKRYKERTGRVMLLDVVEQELECGKRIVAQNKDWLVIVPFWAVWPFETMILPKRYIASLNSITNDEQNSLASIMKMLLVKYDNLFKCSFPYSMGWQSAPTGRFLREDRSFWLLHASYLPPLLRSASVKKFMAGYELVCEPQRDISPEHAAEMLREQSDVHYTQKQ